MSHHDPAPADRFDAFKMRLFGYKRQSVRMHLSRFMARQAQWSAELQDTRERLKQEQQQITERRQWLTDELEQVRLQYAQAQQQLRGYEANWQYTEAGIHHEISRITAAHEQRMEEFDAVEVNLRREIHQYQEQIADIARSLNDLMQESQRKADRALAASTPGFLVRNFTRLVLGIAPDLADAPSRLADHLLCYHLPHDKIAVTTREGMNLGFLRGLLVGTPPLNILGYQVQAPNGALRVLKAEDVLAHRFQHILVSNTFQYVDIEKLVPPTRQALHVEPPATPAPSARIVDRDGDGQAPTSRPEMEAIREETAPGNNEGKSKQDACEVPFAASASAEASVRCDPLGSYRANESETHRLGAERDADELSGLPDHPADPSYEESGLAADAAMASASPTGEGNRLPEEDASPAYSYAIESTVRDPEELGQSAKAGPSADHDGLARPLWSQQAETAALKGRRLDLSLPGVTEKTPPQISEKRADQVPVPPTAAGDGMVLPGLESSPPPLASTPPLWTEQLSAPAPAVVAAMSTPPPDQVADRPPETGGFDVRAFMFGKHVGQEVTGPDGTVLARVGDLITPELVAQLEQAGQLPDLIVHMVI